MGTSAVRQGAVEPAPPVDEPLQYLTFLAAQEMYAVNTLSVREIIEYNQVTTVPMMPAFLRGVINLRGSVVPVVDLKARFDKGTTELGSRTCIVILEAAKEGESQVLGVVVDSVSEVIEILDIDIKPAPAFGNHIRTDFIRGMTKVRGEFVTLLQIEHVLCVDEMAGLMSV
ncbi:CheW protein [Pseudomonas sp. SJZ103]|jgi:purine-binding chemotaxis protein CheW|uniref:chemotaxis protein CheW n=1 Tax=unclassified Pseudomonas TaxID=196821 RepID=UPI0010400E5F|nr:MULTISPECIES: chemotaxis protein CheW [unclassified Pseudomonas]MBB6287552.1 purine-binding chemotaxis protein CheW [Pseudomonas sp. SJZ073]MBB6310521.1 purine-binding chemotaxis protein CheW [Pseudomonas sp. JAI120]MCS4311088.1 purine-binding chemotaxis protein CheW [Pseudomonas sp. BIGb0381]NJJ56779.1 purine-binding chemotaxis protein CheW [Pseudomonas sp. B14(2022)]TWC61374.1 CheW protein [Pseudomonas sp. SJZ103]